MSSCCSTCPQLETHLPPDAAEAGVILTDLRTAVREHPELVARFLGQPDGPGSHAHFWALAQAAWTGGLFCYVPAGVAVDGTLVARQALPRADVAFHPVSAGRGRGGELSVTLLEEIVSPDGDAGWYGGIAEVRAAQSSRVRYANLQQLGDGAWHVGADARGRRAGRRGHDAQRRGRLAGRRSSGSTC